MTKRRVLMLVLGIIALGALSALRLSQQGAPSSRGDAEAAASATYQGNVFGSTFSVKALLPSGVTEEQVHRATDQIFREVDRAMSTYRADSELSALNRAPRGEPQRVGEALFEVLSLSAQVHRETHGAFDITVGPLVRAWGFGAGPAPKEPSAEELAALLRSVGAEHLSLAVEAQTVIKQRDGMSIDLNAVAPGYAADQVAGALEGLGVVHYLVDVGGEIRTSGLADGVRPWKLGIERPDPGGRSVFGTILLRDAALATSGDYRNFRETAEGTVSHTLDPLTGRPVPRRTASVSVVRPTAAEADALATGLGVLDAEEALRLAAKKGWAVLLLLHRPGGGFVVRMSPGWQNLNWQTAEGSSRELPDARPAQ